MKFNQQLEQLLKTLSQFTDAEGELLKQNVKLVLLKEFKPIILHFASEN
jgi:hypothetical protein